MAERLIFGLNGSPGTGKTTLGGYLASEYGFEVQEGSDLINAAALEKGVELKSREDYEQFFRSQQAVISMSWLSDLVLRSSSERVLQCGLRSKYDYFNLQSAGGIVVALECPPQICLSRIDVSNPKNPQTLEEYAEHQRTEESSDEFGSHTLWVGENADYTVDTSGTLEQSYAQLDAVVTAALD